MTLLATVLLQARAAEGEPDLSPRAIPLPEAGDMKRGWAPLLQEAMDPAKGGKHPETNGGAIAEIIRGFGAGVGQVQGRLHVIQSFPHSSHLTKMI